MLSKLLAIHLKIPVNFFHSANQNASIEDKICIKKWNEKDTHVHTQNCHGSIMFTYCQTLYKNSHWKETDIYISFFRYTYLFLNVCMGVYMHRAELNHIHEIG